MPIENPNSLCFPSPIGSIQILSTEWEITEIQLGSDVNTSSVSQKEQRVPAILLEAQKQILAYLAGDLMVLDFPVKITGSEFDRKVWKQLREIQYGKALTYGDVATSLGNKKLSRAVGGACKRNLLPLYIPCHRVLGARSIGGWSQRPGQKEQLLQIENRHFSSESPAFHSQVSISYVATV